MPLYPVLGVVPGERVGSEVPCEHRDKWDVGEYFKSGEHLCSNVVDSPVTGNVGSMLAWNTL